MLVEQILFFIAAAGALAGALGVVLLRNPFYNVLALVAHLLSLATLFLLLRAEFLAAAQVVVYAGAVMVLYVFVVAYIGGADEPLGRERSSIGALGVLFAGALLVEIAVAVIGSAVQSLSTRGPKVVPDFGSPAQIGRELLQSFLVPFEAASFLLLVAAVGAVVLAGRRRGLEELGAGEGARGAGLQPIGHRDGGDGSAPSVEDATRLPAGAAEGPGDPTTEHAPEPQTASVAASEGSDG